MTDLTEIEKLAREALHVVASTNIQFDNDRLDRARFVPALAAAVLELVERVRKAEHFASAFRFDGGEALVLSETGLEAVKRHEAWRAAKGKE